MKYVFFVSLFFLNDKIYSQVITTVQWQPNSRHESGDTIYYSSYRKLNWNDFRGNPDQNSDAAAVTASGFGYMLTRQTRNSNSRINITVYCHYNKVKSWVKTGMQSDYALEHEQHHFDISYLGTLLFIEKLRAASFTVRNYVSLAERIYDECYDAMQNMQDEYDGETRNGRQKNVQAEWNKKIVSQLEAGSTDLRSAPEFSDRAVPYSRSHHK